MSPVFRTCRGTPETGDNCLFANSRNLSHRPTRHFDHRPLLHSCPCGSLGWHTRLSVRLNHILFYMGSTVTFVFQDGWHLSLLSRQGLPSLAQGVESAIGFHCFCAFLNGGNFIISSHLAPQLSFAPSGTLVTVAASNVSARQDR